MSLPVRFGAKVTIDYESIINKGGSSHGQDLNKIQAHYVPNIEAMGHNDQISLHYNVGTFPLYSSMFSEGGERDHAVLTVQDPRFTYADKRQRLDRMQHDGLPIPSKSELAKERQRLQDGQIQFDFWSPYRVKGNSLFPPLQWRQLQGLWGQIQAATQDLTDMLYPSETEMASRDKGSKVLKISYADFLRQQGLPYSRRVLAAERKYRDLIMAELPPGATLEIIPGERSFYDHTWSFRQQEHGLLCAEGDKAVLTYKTSHGERKTIEIKQKMRNRGLLRTDEVFKVEAESPKAFFKRILEDISPISGALEIDGYHREGIPAIDQRIEPLQLN